MQPIRNPYSVLLYSNSDNYAPLITACLAAFFSITKKNTAEKINKIR